MLGRLGRIGREAASRALHGLKRGGREAEQFLRLGPRGYRASRRRDSAEDTGGNTFPNGVTTALTRSAALNWHVLHRKPMVIVLVGETAEAIDGWMWDAHRILRCHFLVSEAMYARLPEAARDLSTALAAVGTMETTDLTGIRLHLQSLWRYNDILFLDLAQPVVAVEEVIHLQYAANQYHKGDEIGFAAPAYVRDGIVTAGFDYDRTTREWAAVTQPELDLRQDEIPRYSLTAVAHGFYATHRSLDRVDLPRGELTGLSLNDQVGVWVRNGWRGNVRTLTFAQVRYEVREVAHPTKTAAQAEWLDDRDVDSPAGRRIIFILNATSISGGIRTVFEQTNDLRRRGFDVEVWSREGQPTWFELDTKVRTFRDYEDMVLALRSEDAIKVATWWETAEVVWLASVNHGIPVYYAQEFETWFYPDEPGIQAAVAASYRREFATLTIAGYQVAELAGVGVTATMISSGYDSSVFHPLPGAERDEHTVLALGRSFFQKNFTQTLEAWRTLGDERPKLLLFGTEPDLVEDERVDYVERPSDAEVNALYNRATVFVQTSLHEGFGLPIIEAMAAGCPVITTDSHGNRDFCTPDVNCVMVEQHDVDGLAEAFRALLADPAKQERLRQAGLETAARYSWSVVVEKIAAYYAGLR